MSSFGSNRIANYQRPVDLLQIAQRSDKAAAPKRNGEASFKEVFSEQLANDREVYFSKHASQRLFSRGIELTDSQMTKVAEAIDRAEMKGSKETLLLADDYALVVSIKDRTVITAFDKENLRDGVVTAIDSAVIL